jgi:hypothetical protein
MHLVEIFLPLADNNGDYFDDVKFAVVRDTLAKQFGGVTAFARAPAQGVFRQNGRNIRDDIIVIEVMAEELDRGRWTGYRKQLEEEFAQDEIMIRATLIEKL